MPESQEDRLVAHPSHSIFWFWGLTLLSPKWRFLVLLLFCLVGWFVWDRLLLCTTGWHWIHDSSFAWDYRCVPPCCKQSSYLHSYVNLVSTDYLTETTLNLKTKSTTLSLQEEPIGHDLLKRINSNQGNIFRCQMDGSDNKLYGTKGWDDHDLALLDSFTEGVGGLSLNEQVEKTGRWITSRYHKLCLVVDWNPFTSSCMPIIQSSLSSQTNLDTRDQRRLIRKDLFHWPFPSVISHEITVLWSVLQGTYGVR